MSEKKQEIIERHINNNVIQQRTLDGYINATELCSATGKDINDYLNLQETKDFLQQLSTVTGISGSDLIQSIKDTHSETIWVHPTIALDLGQWTGYKANVSDWMYNWKLEFDFTTWDLPMKGKKDKTTKNKKEKDVPQGFEEKIKKTLEYNPNKKKE